MNRLDSTRRAFLKVPAGAAAAAALSAQSSDTLLVAFIGVGNRGSFLLRHMLDVPNVRVVAVCDLVEERARQAASAVEARGGPRPKVYTDYKKMLEEMKEIQAVVGATPDFTHIDVYPAVLERGIHLYGEKPVALTPEHCRIIASQAKRSKGLMSVGFQLRHDPNRNAVEKFIHAGGLGKVLMCHGMRHGGDLPRNIPWYFDRTKCGDIVIDQGIHILDLFLWAIGSRPLRAMGSGGQNLFVDDPPGRTVMDNYNLILEYPGGVRVNFSHHYFDPPGFTGIQERVFGSKGSADLIAGTWQPREQKGPPIKLDVPNAGKDSTFMALAEFADCIRNNRQPVNHIDSAVDSTLQAIMATKAIYEKRIVTWEEVAGA
jgi:predicted dehydrogenase